MVPLARYLNSSVFVWGRDFSMAGGFERPEGQCKTWIPRGRLFTA